jgi:predicted acylesterase/phospholipase RssA
MENIITDIVLSGGAYFGLYEIGVLYKLHTLYNIEKIKSIHGTSIGGLISVIISLNIDMDIVKNYIINRPWNNIINISPLNIINIISKKGLLNPNILNEIIIPLFDFKEIKHNITLSEYYEINNINLNFYTIDINNFQLIQINYKTFPDLELLTAIQMTCALPFIFEPVKYNNTYYIDGGILNNYPLENCINETDNIDNILSINICDNKIYNNLPENSNIFEYSYFLYKKITNTNKNFINNTKLIKYEINIECSELNIEDTYKILNNKEERKSYIEYGEIIANKFLLSLEN